MKQRLFSLSLFISFLPSFLPFFISAQTKWSQADCHLPTRWSKLVNEKNALIEYSRPQMKRNNWQNLNGLWDYEITAKDAVTPTRFDGEILVPYPIESALSSVKKALLPSENLWDKR